MGGLRIDYPHPGEVCTTILASQADIGAAPTVRELARQFDMSINAAHLMLARFEEDGLIVRHATRAIKVTEEGLEAVAEWGRG